MHDEPRNAPARLARRRFLKNAALGTAALWATSPLHATARLLAQRARPRATPPKHARAVIQIWMWGGPSHLDTFDPKPEAGPDYTGPLDAPIETKVSGIRFGQLLPELAKTADQLCVLRGMTHGINSHETAAYIVQTGWPAGGRVVHPCAGAVVAKQLAIDAGYQGLIPPYIVVTRPQGRFSEAGFLGSRYKPYATGGDPARTPFLVEGISAPGISRARQERRRRLLEMVDGFARHFAADPRVREFRAAQERAYDLILGEAGQVFDLSTEDAKLRERYGRSTFGQSCLLARRLVEKGVPYVTINANGWDTHKKHFEAMRRMLPAMDRGFATLVQDLKERGLGDDVIVWWSGEFGRGPRVQWEAPWNGGRSHYGRAFSAVLAGGGFRGGQVVGRTDERGEKVLERPIQPCDLLETLYTRLGIDASLQLRHPQGQLVPLLPDPSVVPERGGVLRELV